MIGKRAWIPIIIALATVGGGIWWWHRAGESTQARPDCDIAAQLLDSNAASAQEQDALQAAGADRERLNRYKSSVEREQRDADQIQDPSIKDKARAFVEADRELFTRQTELFNNPFTSAPADELPSQEVRDAVVAYRQLAEKFRDAHIELRQACPAETTKHEQ
ncbi:hypothetical protein MA5S0422_0769 [Mycobacteroides abscessus 5S-0422]|uniref:Uncharacterized protein n=1 Tax=Mycobacteroides abscessus subsp. bolletii 1513 TaxID=1299321 RepID=X8E1Y2_9MYCO|nr:hypothetical protein [Mycobacteroides abscessus]EUA73948.1 hypothetical protein I540_0843 [Mycobacteroides abscessus subsp. bolletii 1513]EIU08901.1 hypothetical protein MA5S0304_5359 [Mycobacteroides abscessus 5S-0304]EIU17081.1 hypothetical protein MA5S0421_0167 [Mycobacteroides abscessus 5S-0421]EIU19058.1 hypothetical protein MA5S0422_0769 [Mycobacteroides abscessus 5S-0422]EIU25785.1 hypothetical protein MA5S0817_4913 [Mycobacteroides abscessus 5S-0817]